MSIEALSTDAKQLSRENNAAMAGMLYNWLNCIKQNRPNKQTKDYCLKTLLCQHELQALIPNYLPLRFAEHDGENVIDALEILE